MFIIRRVGMAQPGRRDEAVRLIKELYAAMEKNAGRVRSTRIVTGSIGASDSLIETETHFETLAEFEEDLKRANAMPDLPEIQQRLAAVMVPGTNRFEIFRLQT